jgi:hypothetical protein
VATFCGVWVAAALFAIPAARSKYICAISISAWRTDYCKYVLIFQLLVSCLLPGFAIFYCMVQRDTNLVESSSSLSEATQNPRLKKPRIEEGPFSGFTLLFLIINMSYHILDMYFYLNINFDFSSFSFIFDVELVDGYNLRDIIFILQIHLAVNSYLVPLALFNSSLAFKRQFKHYLTSCYKTNSPPNDLELTPII